MNRSLLRHVLVLALLVSGLPSFLAGDPVARTVVTSNAGSREESRRDVLPDSLQYIDAQGEKIESPTPGRTRRILIELRARPAVVGKASMLALAQAASERRQLMADLAAVDQRLHAREPARVTREFEMLFSGVAAIVSAESVDAIRRLPEVVAVHEDREIHSCETAVDGVTMIGAPAIWQDYGVIGRDVRVAVIDSGVDYTHTDLGRCFGQGCKVAGGYDFVNGDADPMDDNGHGTHVAGIIAANGALKGVAPGATLLAYKVLNAQGSGYLSAAIAALERAVLDGAKVANLSFSSSGHPDDPISQAVDQATAAGILCVVAAGNAGPGDRTVGTPGVARSALTVGAINQSGDVALFSSRGYVSNGGDEFAMKPEIAAPGVSIRSTVPRSGAVGDPTGYRVLNGTSMATPHVAGAAALLLEWSSQQTPAALKQRLVGSANEGGPLSFAAGAGRVDLARAFTLRILASPTYVPMGVATEASGTVRFHRTLSLVNSSPSEQTISLSAATQLPPGATLQISPAAATLAVGGSTVISLDLEVDQAMTPAAAGPLAWFTSIAVATPGQTTSVPVYFFKGSLVTADFGEAPLYVMLGSSRAAPPPATSSRIFVNPGPVWSDVVPPAEWDILAGYDGAAHAIVVREQQQVASRFSLTLSRSEATRALTLRAVDEAGRPLWEDSTRSRLILGLKDAAASRNIAGALILNSTTGAFLMSPLSSRYALGAINVARNAPGTRFYSYSWFGDGFSTDLTLPVPGVAMRRLSLSATAPAPEEGTDSIFSLGIGHSLRFSGWGFGAVDLSSDVLQSTAFVRLNRATAYLQSIAGTTGDFPIELLRRNALQASGPSGLTTLIQSPYMRHQGGEEIALDSLAFFSLFDPARQPIAVLDASVQRWDLDLAPSVMQIQFRNTASSIYAHSRVCAAGEPFLCDTPALWQTLTLANQLRVSGVDPVFRLYRSGSLVGEFIIDRLHFGIASAAGAHEIRSTSPAYRLGSVIGASTFVAKFDTDRSDRNPPSVIDFRVEQDGLRTATPLQPSLAPTTYVRFGVFDDNAIANVELQWRRNGTSEWTAFPLAPAGGKYSVPFQLEGAIDLRVLALDAAGNTFEEEWTPAIVTTMPPVVSRIQPSAGPAAGGNVVTVSGTDLTGGIVTFGGIDARVTNSSATALTVIVPPHSLGPVAITVTTTSSAGGSATLSTGYTYEPPTITAVSPTSGPVTGGQTMTVTGRNLTGVIVSIGGVAVIPLAGTPSTLLQFVTPAHASGAVDITVTSNVAGGGTATALGAYLYRLAPAVTSISPDGGPTIGSQIVTIAGENLEGASALLGGKSAFVQENTATVLKISTPSHIGGAVDLVISTPGGSVALANAYTYVPPQITSVSPASGSTSGGQVITITGTNLNGTITMDGLAVTSFGGTATRHSFVSPPHSAGTVHIAMGTAFGSGTAPFTYVAAPAITNILPSSGPTSGGQAVSITGSNLDSATVTFGTRAAVITGTAATSITLATPMGAAGSVDVMITTAGGTAIVPYTYVPPPAITSINPSSGPTNGGQSVTISGNNLAGVTVRIGGERATVTAASATTVTFSTPARVAGTVDVVATNAGGAATSPQMYTYVAAAPPPPAVVNAAASSTTAILVSWTPVASADRYQVFRDSGAGYALVATVLNGTSYNDLSLAPSTAYLYRVRAVTSSLVSADSLTAPATTIVFSDDPLVSLTPLRASHLYELRSAVNALRARAGLSAATWADLSVEAKKVQAAHILELRSALDAARNALLLPRFVYRQGLSIESTYVQAVDFMDIRDGTRSVLRP